MPTNRSKRTDLDDLIEDELVQLAMRADGVAEAEFRDLLHAAGWKLARSREAHLPDSPTLDGAQAINDYRLGVGVMLLDRRNRVFLGRRIGAGSDAWQMPQGGIEPGEQPWQAAFRELKEEIGTDNAEIVAESVGWHRYDLPPDLLGKAWHGRWRGQRQKWFVMRFLGEEADIDVATADPEFSEWKWVPATEIADAVVEFKRQLYADLVAEFGGGELKLQA